MLVQLTMLLLLPQAMFLLLQDLEDYTFAFSNITTG